MVQIKDIAKECNVSVATVSKALNDHTDIGEETKKRIRAKAAEMGYMPNSAARALKTSKTNNIGILFVDKQNSGLTHEYFSNILESIKNTAEQLGYDITFISNHRNMTYLQHCLSRQVEGVIIACVDFFDPQVVELVNSSLPTVVVDYEFGKKISVMSDNYEGGKSIMQFVYEMGHRNIGIIHGESTDVTYKRLKGMRDYMSSVGLEIPMNNIKESKFHDSQSTYFITQELINRADRPTCIIFPDDYSYIGGMNAINDAGLTIPDDISAIGYDGIQLSRIISPRLVTYHQNTKAIGEYAAKKLIEQIDNPNKEYNETIQVKGFLLDGGTVRKM